MTNRRSTALSDSVSAPAWTGGPVAVMVAGMDALDENVSVGAPGDAFFPRIAADAAGNVLAVWEQGIGELAHVWSNRYVAGSGWGTAVRIDAAGPGCAFSPNLASAPDGTAVVVWEQWNDDFRSVWARHYSPAAGWGAAKCMQAKRTDPAIAPHVAMDWEGNAIVVWRQLKGVNYYAYANRYLRSVGWTGAKRIGGTFGSGVSAVQVALDAAGDGFAIWKRGERGRSDVCVLRHTAENGWEKGVDLLDTGTCLTAPQIVINNRGDAVAVWGRMTGNLHRLCASSCMAGEKWEAPRFLDGDLDSDVQSESVNPHAAIDARGNSMIVWERIACAGSGVWSCRNTASSGWETSVRVVGGDQGANPQLVVDAEGRALVAWVYFDNKYDRVRINRYAPETGWQAARDVGMELNAGAMDVQLLVNPDGAVTMAWEHYGHTGNSIRCRRLNGTGGGLA